MRLEVFGGVGEDDFESVAEQLVSVGLAGFQGRFEAEQFVVINADVVGDVNRRNQDDVDVRVANIAQTSHLSVLEGC